MIAWNEKLNALRAVIATECVARIRKDHKLNINDVAEWLLGTQRQAVIEGLTDLINQVIDQRNDDLRVKRLLGVSPDFKLEQSERLRGARENAETLGIPLSYLLQLDLEKSKQCLETVCFISRLHVEESTAEAEAAQRQVEILRPVWDVHPDMTFGQAMAELKRKTDETIRELDAESEEPINGD